MITDKLVIPEGFTVRDMAAAVAALRGLHLSAQKFVAAATDGTVRSPYEPAGVNNLEGLLFPVTYPVQQGETEVDIVTQMVTAFDQRAQEIGLQVAAARLGQTPYALVTVASIVEKEAKLTSDRGPVASVIYNRLKAGIPLGDDSTQTYYLRLTNPTLQPTADEIEEPGPYNTRTNKGLPSDPDRQPGPPLARCGCFASSDRLSVLRLAGQVRRAAGLRHYLGRFPAGPGTVVLRHQGLLILNEGLRA